MGDLRSKAEQAAAMSPMERGAAAIAAAGTSFAEAARRPETVPVETDPSIPTDLDVPVHVAWSRVMGEVQFIAKGRQTEQGTRYRYRGVDDIMNAVGPAIRKHGVIVIPVAVSPTFQVITTTKGAAMNYCRAVVEFAIIGPRGDQMSVTGQALGEAFDSGDKSGTKAASVAMRTFYTQALAIPTDRPQMDPEHGEQHAITGPPRPTAEEYAAEIVGDATSLDRLRQIKAELIADRAMGMTEVEPFGYEPIRLIDLVQQVGRKRAGGDRK